MSSATFIKRGHRIGATKPVKTDHGIAWEADGFQEADIHVTVDMEAIARSIGGDAMTNKSGVSKYLGGAVVVRAVNKKRIPA